MIFLLGMEIKDIKKQLRVVNKKIKTTEQAVDELSAELVDYYNEQGALVNALNSEKLADLINTLKDNWLIVFEHVYTEVIHCQTIQCDDINQIQITGDCVKIYNNPIFLQVSSQAIETFEVKNQQLNLKHYSVISDEVMRDIFKNFDFLNQTTESVKNIYNSLSIHG